MTAEPSRSMPPHWSDDPRFNSEAHYDDVMAGRATLSKEQQVFVGVEDGVAIYRDRKNLTGVDVAMMRDQTRREASEKMQWALYNFYKEAKK